MSTIPLSNPEEVSMFIKRIVAATFVTALTLVGVAPAATAAKSDTSSVKVVKPAAKPDQNFQNRIDWD